MCYNASACTLVTSSPVQIQATDCIEAALDQLLGNVAGQEPVCHEHDLCFYCVVSFYPQDVYLKRVVAACWLQWLIGNNTSIS